MVSVEMFIFSVCQGHTSYTPLLLLTTGGARLYRPEKAAQIVVVAEKVTARSVMQCGTTCFETPPPPVYLLPGVRCNDPGDPPQCLCHKESSLHFLCSALQIDLLFLLLLLLQHVLIHWALLQLCRFYY